MKRVGPVAVVYRVRESERVWTVVMLTTAFVRLSQLA